MNVLCAVDGSEWSEWSGVLPKSARVTVLSVAQPFVPDLAASVLAPAALDQLTRSVIERAAQIVARVREQFVKERYEVTTAVRASTPAQPFLPNSKSSNPMCSSSALEA